jgi:hypothetical protein
MYIRKPSAGVPFGNLSALSFLSLSWGPTPTTLPALAPLAPLVTSDSLLGGRFCLGLHYSMFARRLRASLGPQALLSLVSS